MSLKYYKKPGFPGFFAWCCLRVHQRRYAELFVLIDEIRRRGQQNRHKAKPYALHADKQADGAGQRHADMERQQRQPVKACLGAGVAVSTEDEVGGQHNRLPHIIGGENGGAGIAVGDFVGVPLHGRSENQRIARDEVIRRNMGNGAGEHHSGRRTKQADDFHADRRPAAHQHIEHIAGGIRQKAEEHPAHEGEVTLDGVQHHFYQVTRLGVAEDIHVVEYRIAAPKSANHTCGIMNQPLPAHNSPHILIPSIQ